SASKMTSRGTPFSLATASTTSRSSLLICVNSACGTPAAGLLEGLLASPAPAGSSAPPLLGRVPARHQAQRGPVGYQARPVDVVGRHRELVAVQLEHHGLPLDAQDTTLQAPASLLGQFQADLGLLALEACEVLQREQGAIQARRGHLEGVVARDRIGHVQLGRDLAADRLAIVDG